MTDVTVARLNSIAPQLRILDIKKSRLIWFETNQPGLVPHFFQSAGLVLRSYMNTNLQISGLILMETINLEPRQLVVK